MNILHLYLLLINAMAFLFMLVDKIKAKTNRRRIPERTLFLSAWLGGSVGILLGVHLFRHKTRKFRFTLGIPAIIIVQFLTAFYIYTHFGA